MSALSGLKVIELSGIGPGPFAGMLLADMGADVVRIDRLEASGPGLEKSARFDVLNRNKRSIALDIKSESGRRTAMSLIERADVLIEGFRPGVLERLGLGPDACWERNPRLVYGRVTGWGQDGPLSATAGHDLNYIALTGALHAIGPRAGVPTPPLNLVGDYGGGAAYLVIGILCALHEAKTSGRGQAVDAAMIDGAASLMTALYGLKESGYWHDERGNNLLDGAAYFYGVYETLDGKYVSIAPIEPKFYTVLLAKLGLNESDLPPQADRARWPDGRRRLEAIFKTRTREQWCVLFEGSDACFAPVLSMDEACEHPHNRARGMFVDFAGVRQPAPAPRLSRTPAQLRRAPPEINEHAESVLAEWGVEPAAVG